MMRILVFILVGLVVIYHLLMTSLMSHRPEIKMVLPLLRDGLRIAIVLIISVEAIKKAWIRANVVPLIRKIRPIFLGIAGFVGRGVFHTLSLEGVFQQIFVGIKYDIRFFVLGFLAIIWGYRAVLAYGHTDHIQITHFLHKVRTYAWRWILAIVIGGFLRQLSKLLRTDLFLQFGYGPIGDYAYAMRPPLWYRTWPGGEMRWSWLFAGPNNYGYFLVSFFAFFVIYAKKALAWMKLSSRNLWLRSSIGLYILAVALTFSRAALIGCVVQLPIIRRWRKEEYLSFYPRLRSWLYKWWLWMCCGFLTIFVGLIIMISIYKRDSTREHIEKTMAGIELVVEQPWGYGLWSSGPAIHRWGKYLPENMYLQILLDWGWIWFIFRLFAWLWWLYLAIYVARQVWGFVMWWLVSGYIGLSAEGLFLHVREDSMVNMLYLGLAGVSLGIALHSRSKKEFNS